MSNQEKFKKTFDKLKASPDVITEVLNMTEEKKVIPIWKKYLMSKVAVAVAAVALFASSGTAVYAMNVGGIQRIVQVWIHGDQTDATFSVENGTYSLQYTDEEGNVITQGGGGVALEGNEERPLSEEELLDYLTMPDVEYKDDGTIWIYYLNQKMEITDKFEDGICYVKLAADGKEQYVTVKYQNGFAVGEKRYIQPSEFN